MPGEGAQPPLECARSDRRDVVDESLRGHFRQLGGHVAANRNQVRPVRRKYGIKGPVVVRTREKNLLAGLGIDRPHRIVGAAKCDLGAIGRPAHAVNGVVSDRHRKSELAFGDVPDLDFAHARRQPARDGQLLAVGRKRQRLDAFGQSDQPADELGAIRLPEQDLVKPGDGQ